MKKLPAPFLAVVPRCRCLVFLAILVFFPAALCAQVLASQPAAVEITQTHFDESDPQPTLTANGSWAGTLLIVVAGMFVAAACIGPMVCAQATQEVPPDHAHDEPPGGGGHHGQSGAVEQPHHQHH